MHVKNILSAKGGNVVSIEPTATLETAVRTLTEHKIGALLVFGPDRRVIGILSGVTSCACSRSRVRAGSRSRCRR